ncbi:hypothetical protein GW721_24345, partial [Citrobacter braakii]|nr:hypothetical protein [Citrobacter braakii]
MKQFKNAVAVAIAAAGLYSVSAMAGTAVHWAGSDAGSAKDVKWQVVQPSRLDFTVNTADITSVGDRGEVNGGSPTTPGNAGEWVNDGDAVYVLARHNQTMAPTGSYSIAYGDNDNERLEYRLRSPDGKDDMFIDGKVAWPAHVHGEIDGVLKKLMGGDWMPVAAVGMLTSTHFTD